MVTTSFVGERDAKSSTVSLADLNDLQVELDISQNDFNRISPEQPCTAVTDVSPDRSYECVVAEIAPEAERQRGTIQVKVQILDPDTLIKTEMNARVTFLDPEAKVREGTEQMSIPAGALIDHETGKDVMILVDGVGPVKAITVDREVDDVAYVAAGFTGDESIIIGDALQTLESGDRVEGRPE